MNELTRVQIGQLIRKEAATLVLGTALLFLGAGSFWSHFAMYELFLTPEVLLSWALIHGCSALSLKFQNRDRLLSVFSFAALQMYFYVTLFSHRTPFLPSAPIFFLVSVVSLTAYANQNFWNTVVMWGLGWISTHLWIHKFLDPDNYFNRAMLIATFLNAIVILGFVLVSRWMSARTEAQIESLGPSKDFDPMKIHASKLQTLGEIAASLAHEISNPLAAIAGYSHQIRGEILEGTPPSIELLQVANDRIKFNVDRVTVITRVIRSFARNTVDDEMGPVSVKDILEDALVMTKQHLKEQGIELKFEWPLEDAFVKGSLVELSQIVVNLFTNARDAMEDSDRKLLSIGFASDEESVDIWVEDTGPGIPEASKEKIFKPFFTTKGVGKGTGLGLSICRTIAERHQGHLEYLVRKDQAGRVLGTRFILKIPRLVEEIGTEDDQGVA